ncbi:MAG: GNAT family N-acetyltransferase [Polaribacter sp.]|nr:GNAT family N-acetyltransferase [Polaribacter sp.]MDG1994634.1 GNAT family N-acetyltransferase [Polaribacter sp.]
MEFLVKEFYQLSLDELYRILQLRSEIFVVEQDCVYQDLDFKDQHALHVIGIKKNQIIAYTRIFKPGEYYKEASIGRVVVDEKERKFGYGHDLMKASIKTILEKFNTTEITISAQVYLKKFYESHGFKKVGDEYLEDGIQHVEMIKK